MSSENTAKNTTRWGVVTIVITIAFIGVLFLINLGSVGFLGPDEPRYASIGREMARSGDWITPRLNSQPWFEKPPLTYWLTAIGHLVGLPDEWAARFPQVLVSVAFLFFFYKKLAREFSVNLAITATAILATSIGWLAYSFVAVTDLPMSAALGAAILVVIFDQQGKGTESVPGALNLKNRGWVGGALLGISILGKGFVPVVLFAPVWLMARGKRWTTIAGAVLVAGPWFVLCWAHNGAPFWDDFFWKQHISRFFSPSLEHVQPFWFYVPVLLAGLFPWTPLAGLLINRKLYDDRRIRLLAGWVVYGLIFFSASRNKLPGYVLPLIPALAIVLATALERTSRAGYWLASCGLMLVALPTGAKILPRALSVGLSRANIDFVPAGLIFVVIAGVAVWLASRKGTSCGAVAVALAMGIAIVFLMFTTFPVLDRQVSVRNFYRENLAQNGPGSFSSACLDNVNRTWEYGLNYYAAKAMPQCAENPGIGRPRITIQSGRLTLVKP